VVAEIAAVPPGTVQLSILGWNKKLMRYVKDGQPGKAMQLFQQMQREGMSPDKFTFVQLAGSHAGLVDEGMCLYASMIKDYMIAAELEHYT
jgi:pentatricopeptide repeat protein